MLSIRVSATRPTAVWFGGIDEYSLTIYPATFDANERAKQVLTAWSEGLPDTILSKERDALDQARMFELAYVNTCAEQFLTLVEIARSPPRRADRGQDVFARAHRRRPLLY